MTYTVINGIVFIIVVTLQLGDMTLYFGAFFFLGVVGLMGDLRIYGSGGREEWVFFIIWD